MDITVFSDEYFMKEALKEAGKAMDRDEVPVGSVIVANNMIIARSHNLTETLNDTTAHAEMQAFTAASGYLGGKCLNDCALYVTLEPCTMCAGAAYWTRIGKIVWGADDEKLGFTLTNKNLLHPKTEIITGVMEKECAAMIREFFREKRK